MGLQKNLILTWFRRWILIAGIGLAGAAGADDSAQGDPIVEVPKLSAPVRGSLSGELAGFELKADSLQRGTLSLPLPLKFPEDRGRLLFPFAPKYSASAGLSEWGLGFGSSLRIFRYRTVGHLSFKDDQWMSPWGELKQGRDGAFYPAGFQSSVRLQYEESSERWVAILANGDRLIFGGRAGVMRSSRGVFAWSIVQATSLKGEQTQFSYRDREHVSDPLLLSKVRYGGRQERFQYEVNLGYQALSKPYLDWRGGERSSLNERVDSIAFSVRVGESWVERYRYQVGVTQAPFGPGFFLTSLQRLFASGKSEPSIRFSYGEVQKLLMAAQWQVQPHATELVRKYPNAFVPERISPAPSGELDGRSQIELADSFATIRSIHGKLELTPGSRTTGAHETCQPDPGNPRPRPRLLNQVRGLHEPIEVLGFETQDSSSSSGPPVETILRVCTRQGVERQKLMIAGNWKPGTKVRLADLTRDGKPELLRILPAGSAGASGSQVRVEVLLNESTHERVAFSSQAASINLGGTYPNSQPVFLVEDVNGDSLVDLAAVWNSGISVWYGKGQLEFEFESVSIPFRVDGIPLQGLTQKRISLTDLNGDGLPDALVQNKNGTVVLMNEGTFFSSVQIPALIENRWAAFSRPFSFDLLDSGNTQLVAYDSEADAIKVLELTAPGSNLLESMDDGRGNRLKVEYARAEAEAGLGSRWAVVAQAETQIIGEGNNRSRYQYAQPVSHGSGRQFLGFEKIQTAGRKSTGVYQFTVPQEGPPAMREARHTDSDYPALTRFESHGFQSVERNGISWLRPAFKEEGYLSGTTREALRTEFESYFDGICPSVTRTRSSAGVLLRQMTYERPSLLSDSLACLPRTIVTEGSHPVPTRDFRHELWISRNSQGDPLTLTRQSGANARVLQRLTYDSHQHPIEIATPGKGVTRFTYDPATWILSAVQAPDGVILQAERDPLNDQVIRLSENRGGSISHHKFFLYDELERLKQSRIPSADPNGAESDEALLEYFYREPTDQSLGQIRETLRGSLSGSHFVSEKVDLVSGGGSVLGTIRLLGQGAVLSQVQFRDREVGETTTLNGKALAPRALSESITPGELYAGLTALERSFESGFGFSTMRQQLHESDTSGKIDFVRKLSPTGLQTVLLENQTHATLQLEAEAWRSGGGRLIQRRLPNGDVYRYAYDVLGRLVELRLPQGEVHRLQYDNFGDLRQVSRTHFGSIRYVYEPETGLLTRKAIVDSVGRPVRSESWSYDPIGRLRKNDFTDDVQQKTKTFHFEFDGQGRAAQLGRLTGARGDGWSRSLAYRLDGEVAEERLEIAGFGAMRFQPIYRSDGISAGAIYEKLDPSGASVRRIELKNLQDSSGRLLGLTFNGKAAFGWQRLETSK
jgi:YD repeat-containing protein